MMMPRILLLLVAASLFSACAPAPTATPLPTDLDTPSARATSRTSPALTVPDAANGQILQSQEMND
jgi:hypothetical protein